MVAQLGRVRLQHAVLEVTRPEVHRDVQQVQNVRHVVQAEPHQQRVTVDFLKRKPATGGDSHIDWFGFI